MILPVIRNGCNTITAVMQAEPIITKGLLASSLVLVTCEAITSYFLSFNSNNDRQIYITWYHITQYYAAYPFICFLASHQARVVKVALGIGHVLPGIIIFGNALLKQRIGKIALASLSIVAKLVSSVAIGLFASLYVSPYASGAVGISCFALSMFTAYQTWGYGLTDLRKT